MKLKSLSFTLASMVALLACNAQVGPENQGEPLLVFHGQVVPNGTATPPPAEAALLWFGAASPTTSGYVGVSVPVTGDFPVGFEIRAFAPPPAAAFLSKDFPFAFAWIVALAPNADHSSIGPADVLGASVDTLVLYLARDLPPDPGEFGKEGAGNWTSFPRSAGYHLMKVTRGSPEQHAAFIHCSTGGFCPRFHSDGSSGKAASQLVEILDPQFADCMSATPNATTCDIWVIKHSTPEQEQQTKACEALIDARAKAARSVDCMALYPDKSAEAPADATATVIMGATPWQPRP